jgi:hypothetical protein
MKKKNTFARVNADTTYWQTAEELSYPLPVYRTSKIL